LSHSPLDRDSSPGIWRRHWLHWSNLSIYHWRWPVDWSYYWPIDRSYYWSIYRPGYYWSIYRSIHWSVNWCWSIYWS